MRQSYDADGYVFPVEAMTPDRAAEYRAMFESVEAAHADDAVMSRILRGNPNTVLPFIDEITRLASVLEPVKAILGDDLLVISANFFIKEPATPAFVSWHQDLTYWGYDDAHEATAWVAFSPSTTQSGCMRFMYPGVIGVRSSSIATPSKSRTCSHEARSWQLRWMRRTRSM